MMCMDFLGEGDVCPWAEAVVTPAHVVMGHRAGVRWAFSPAAHQGDLQEQNWPSVGCSLFSSFLAHSEPCF